ncbi:tetratricopeptide repeat protein [Paenibacillus wulumuqiensis]|uniref:tetratricopeptide repeat protein n=1 Tax=Paenibacillus wulumuqiensis TaxID=1567107 RepID=UPI000619DA49|nr:cyclin family protein [Paenibacillus wulumuqiensis]
MNDYKRKVEETERKVITLKLDANFFFERAVRSLDHYRYDKALKYFEKAVEYEPDNPVNHCNMAGILSEMGKYEASNQVLQTIMDTVDPLMVECHFYMANNYANMEQFEQAEQQLLTYLERDPNGQFTSEAEEMMDLILHEMGRTAGSIPAAAVPAADRQEQAHELLERGEFEAACEMLKQLIDEQPDLAAARNNLAVAYYQQGMTKLAAEQITAVLQQDPNNLHALCNQAILSQYHGASEFQQQLDQLCRVTPIHQEHLLKLATTMAMLGEHRYAYNHFRRLLRHDDLMNHWELYHYTAAAACYMGKYDEAEQLWKRILRFESGAEVPAFYLAHLQELRQGKLTPSYRYGVQKMPYFYTHEQSVGRSSEPASVQFLHMLHHGTESEQLQALNSYVLDGNREVHTALRQYVARPLISEELRIAAERLLRQWAANQSLSSDQLIDDIEAARMSLPLWDEHWQQIVDQVAVQPHIRYDSGFTHDVEALWIEFIKRVYPELPQLHHPEGWAAALEYLVARIHRLPLTYDEVAQRYGVSASIISRYARRISRVCNVQQKVRYAQAESTQGS